MRGGARRMTRGRDGARDGGRVESAEGGGDAGQGGRPLRPDRGRGG